MIKDNLCSVDIAHMFFICMPLYKHIPTFVPSLSSSLTLVHRVVRLTWFLSRGCAQREVFQGKQKFMFIHWYKSMFYVHA
jgi:hypothetical protein